MWGAALQPNVVLEGCDTELPPEGHWLAGWLEKEVVSRLTAIDTKIDQLQRHVAPPPRSSRKISVSGTWQSSGPSPWKASVRSSSRKDSIESLHFPGRDGAEQQWAHPPPPPPPSALPPPTPPLETMKNLDVSSIGAGHFKIAKTWTGRFLSDSSANSGPTEQASESASSTASRRPMAGRRRGSNGSCQALEERRQGRAERLVSVWNFLSNPESSEAASWYAAVTLALTLASIFSTLVQTAEAEVFRGFACAVLETSFEVFFGLEWVVRFVTCPSQSRFLWNLHNFIDMLAVLPLALRAYLGFVLPDGTLRDCLLSIVPILRLMKTLRRFERFRLVMLAVAQAFEALPILLFSLLEITLIFSALIFLVEPRDNIDSLPTAIWLTIVTMTTVGYGDVTPSNTPGSIIVSLLVIMSVLYMAMPLGIVGQAFVDVWSNRDRILLLYRTQEHLRQWGYTVNDALQIFRWFDEDRNASLDFDEFVTLVSMMRLGLTKERVRQLFDSMDEDGGGLVGAREFVKFLYPGAYHEIFGSASEHESTIREGSVRASWKVVPKMLS